MSSLKSERVKASEVLKGPEVTTYDGDKKVFFSYFVFLEFILTWVYFSNQWNHTLYFHGWWWISYILIFRSFHAQDLIFTEFSIRALPILLFWFMPKMSNSLTKIHFLVLIKVAFFQKVRFFLFFFKSLKKIIPIKYPELEIWVVYWYGWEFQISSSG